MSTQSHCPYRQSKNLLDALASDKTKVAFLLGAGCPASIPHPDGDGIQPLIPAILGLTADVKKKLGESEVYRGSFNIILKRFSEEEPAEPTIENILSHIRALQEVVRDGDIHGLTKTMLAELDEKICEITTVVVGAELPDSNTPYHQLAKWIGGIQRAQPVEVFTPNYDLLVEQAFEAHKIPYFDGFVGSREAFFDLTSMEENASLPVHCLPVRWSRLWKLHGSINWWSRYEDEDKKNLKVVRTGIEKPIGGDRQMIYPSHLKYDQSRRLPYLAMLDRLKNFLARGQAVLVTCGYSFADEHLNEVIFQGLRSNPTAICFGLLYGPRANYSDALIKKQKHPNLSLLASDGAVLGTIERDWGSANPEHVMHGLSVINKEPTTGDDSTPPNCEFQLGNFKHFGDFLAQQLSRFDDEQQGKEKDGNAA
ncbi:MAG: SIR2 family protein [Polaromonas sp.]|uniref:SIR2 family protein n=1 Tax=Nitrosomonas sp. TaxID=42353 RepID=UPI0027321CC7|nr:SIR2 family protein [Nitrosomonas sp.]MDP1786239.1 SIR2 family protein [Nitrosomonas sp.]MDP2225212.1 SIR2 family protein [Nitrosomonas sp.]MDP3169573.1 SIR2 family protein [Polaromonas sp.]